MEPTPQDIRDVARAVKAAHGPGLIEDIIPMVVVEDTEWCIQLMTWALIHGTAPKFSHAEWLMQLVGLDEAIGEHKMSGEVVIRIVIEGLDKLIVALQANTEAHGHKATVPAEFVKPAAAEAAPAAPAAAPAKPKAVAKPKAAPVAAPAPAAPLDADPDDGFGDPPPAAPKDDKKWTIEELRAEIQLAKARIAKELGVDPAALKNFSSKFYGAAGLTGESRNLTMLNPADYSRMVAWCRTVPAKEIA